MASSLRSPSKRFARLERLLRSLLAQPKFTRAHARQCLPDEDPRYLTRVIGELASEGHLRQDDDGALQWVCDPSAFPAQAWLEKRLCTTQLQEAPAQDRPRERLLALGAEELRTAELLAILIRTGRPGESALDAGERVATRYAKCLERLPEAGRGELTAIARSLGETAYCQIMAGIELGRRTTRAADLRQQPNVRIQNARDAAEYCKHRFVRLAEDDAHEEFHVISLDAKHHVRGTQCVSVGSLDRSLVHPREVFRPAIKEAAKAVIVVHNHPSGDPTPSREDLAVTLRLEEAGKTLGIELLDHIVVARNGTISIREYRR